MTLVMLQCLHLQNYWKRHINSVCFACLYIRMYVAVNTHTGQLSDYRNVTVVFGLGSDTLSSQVL